MEFTLAGYFAKLTAVPAVEGWPASLAHVTGICSVSLCIAKAPEGWIDHWLHNELGWFNSIGDARRACGEDPRPWEIFAYRLAPLRFDGGRAEAWPVPAYPVDPLPPDFRPLGFDAVSRSAGFHFECSPLSCSLMGNEIPVNRHCLVDTLEQAMALAELFSRGEQEPGPYHVVEVWGRRE